MKLKKEKNGLISVHETQMKRKKEKRGLIECS
jgi:hypothetical protein